MRVRDSLLGGNAKRGPREMWLCHGFCEVGAIPLTQGLEEVTRFVVEHPRQVVMIVIQDEGPTPQDLAKAFDDAGLVMHCGSFSKSLAPGYRLGWCAPGRAFQQVERLKLSTSIATSIPIQDAIASFLAQGGYDHHLRALRGHFRAQQERMLCAIEQGFPRGTRMTRASGGYFVWIELPGKVDAMRVYQEAARKGISLAPGPMFSAQRRFGNCLRLNFGHPWNEGVEKAVATLGRIARSG
jgi:DNA-binding transcriptional MocR family regulator